MYFNALSDLVIHIGQHASSCTDMPVSHVQREKDGVLGLHLHLLSCPCCFQEDKPFNVCSKAQHSLQIPF